MRLGVAAVSIALLLGAACTRDGSDAPPPKTAASAPANGEIVFARMGAGSPADERALLFAVSPDDDPPRVRRLSDRRFPQRGLVTFSPDGTRMAFTRRRKLWVGRPDGSAARQVSHTQGLNMLGRWSPNGTQLIYLSRAGIGGEASNVHLVRADGTGFRQIGIEGRPFAAASWAADGRRVYGIDGGGIFGWPALYALDVRSGRAKQLVPAEEGTRWFWASPNGHVLALRERARPLSRELWLLKNGRERLLAETRGEYWDVAWSPDGSRIAVSTLFGDDGTARLVILDPLAETVRIDETSGVPGRDPVWAPDGGALAYAAGRFPHDDVWVLDEEGGTPRRLLRTRAYEHPVAWLPAG